MSVTCEQDCRCHTCSFLFLVGFVLFLNASLWPWKQTTTFSFMSLLCVCVFPVRIRKREMCCVRVLQWARSRDHHWKHCKHPQWVKHVTAHCLLCDRLQVWADFPCWLVVGTEISTWHQGCRDQPTNGKLGGWQELKQSRAKSKHLLCCVVKM